MAAADFIKRFGFNAIVSSFIQPGLYPSVTIAQALIENGGNMNPPGNNVFNIKADGSWTGKVISLATHEYIGGISIPVSGSGTIYNSRQDAEAAGEDDSSLFRVYNSPTDSFSDRNKFLETNSRYADVFQATTPDDQARALKADGYATAPGYADSIISLIDQYNLTTLDKKKTA